LAILVCYHARDLAAIGLWLVEFAHSPHTLRSYRKEALRLVLWHDQHGQPPHDLSSDRHAG
jgi:hypothetical protein